MLDLYPLLGSTWTVSPFRLLLALGWELMCVLHRCEHCSDEVDQLATQGLSCKWSQGGFSRHAAINDIIHRSLLSAKESLPVWNHLVSQLVLIEEDLTGFQWFPGPVENYWCGMLPAQIRTLHLTLV